MEGAVFEGPPMPLSQKNRGSTVVGATDDAANGPIDPGFPWLIWATVLPCLRACDVPLSLFEKEIDPMSFL